jgi:hypothetical protein
MTAFFVAFHGYIALHYTVGSVRWFGRLTMTLVFVAFRSQIGEMVRQAHHDIGFLLLFMAALHCQIGEMVRQAHQDIGFRCFSLPDR